MIAHEPEEEVLRDMTAQSLVQLAYLQGYRDGLERVEKIVRTMDVTDQPVESGRSEAV